jgi:hypothetical protein
MTHRAYHHTQVGWTMILSLGGIGVLLLAVLHGSELPILGLVTAVLFGGLLLLFGTLTVDIDQEHLGFCFGIGLVRKRIALADIRHYEAVRTRWYHGWGIHLAGRGWLYNVSGLDAVELVLRNGKTLRIGTDEPDALVAALVAAVGPPEPLSSTEVEQVGKSTNKAVVWALAILLAVPVIIGALMFFESRPPEVRVGPDRFEVESLVYGETFALAEITEVSLVRGLPRILARTNGFALGGTLRGYFRLAELGKGQLFVELGSPPFVLVRSGPEFVFVGFADPERTKRLFADLEHARQAD